MGASGKSVSQLWSGRRRRSRTSRRSSSRRTASSSTASSAAFTVTQELAFSTTDAFEVLALISLSLAVINLFPFLPLDGGHVFWAVAEKVRGRRIPYETMERASVVGFAVIMLIFVIGLSNDISTLTGSGFNVR